MGNFLICYDLICAKLQIDLLKKYEACLFGADIWESWSVLYMFLNFCQISACDCFAYVDRIRFCSNEKLHVE